MEEQHPATTEPSEAAELPTTRSRTKEWLVQLVVVVIAVGAIRAYQLRGAAEGPAPPIIGRDVAGDVLDLGAANGQPTLVYFWATWCGVCNVVDPNVAAIAEDHRVITIAVRSGGRDEVSAFLRDEGLVMPTLVDPEGRFARAYGVNAFPTSFWVDSDGNIAHREVGYTSTLGFRARLALTD